MSAFSIFNFKAERPKNCRIHTSRLICLSDSFPEMRIEARDLAAYKYFHTEVQGTVPQLSSIVSYIVIDSPKDERA